MESIRNLIGYVVEAGDMAYEEQSRVVRNIKKDGSVVTVIDKKLNDFLSEKIKKEYPDINLITEEDDSSYNAALEYSFAVDPIDGTDPYSQQMPGWCVSVGLLKGATPVAGIIYAPSWGASGGTLVVGDLDGSVEVNGNKIKYCDNEPDTDTFQIMTGSQVFRRFDVTGFDGKIRSAGSSIIAMISPVIHTNMKASIINQAYIWDIAAAHAIVRNYGLKTEYINGSEIDYVPLFRREATSDFIISGFPDYCDLLKHSIL